MEKRKAKRLINRWNKFYSIGTLVTYKMRRGGEEHVGITSTDAFLSDEGEPVIFLQERSTLFPLAYMTPLTAKPFKSGGNLNEKRNKGEDDNDPRRSERE